VRANPQTAPALRDRLRDYLARCQAAPLGHIGRDLALGESSLTRLLGQMAADGEVEMLHPVFARPAATPAPNAFCRLVRPTDSAYLWQRDLFVARRRDASPHRLAIEH
jgi:hypothetical protein